MRVFSDTLQVATDKGCQFIDITDQVCDLVRQSQVSNGFVVIYSRHTTAAVVINENEPLLLQDMEAFLHRIAAPDAPYGHNDFSIRTVNMADGECPNGHSHLQHLFLGASETVPIMAGALQFGRWQRVFLVELDQPRTREVLVQVVGE